MPFVCRPVRIEVVEELEGLAIDPARTRRRQALPRATGRGSGNSHPPRYCPRRCPAFGRGNVVPATQRSARCHTPRTLDQARRAPGPKGWISASARGGWMRRRAPYELFVVRGSVARARLHPRQRAEEARRARAPPTIRAGVSSFTGRSPPGPIRSGEPSPYRDIQRLSGVQPCCRQEPGTSHAPPLVKRTRAVGRGFVVSRPGLACVRHGPRGPVPDGAAPDAWVAGRRVLAG